MDAHADDITCNLQSSLVTRTVVLNANCARVSSKHSHHRVLMEVLQ